MTLSSDGSRLVAQLRQHSDNALLATVEYITAIAPVLIGFDIGTYPATSQVCVTSFRVADSTGTSMEYFGDARWYSTPLISVTDVVATQLRAATAGTPVCADDSFAGALLSSGHQVTTVELGGSS